MLRKSRDLALEFVPDSQLDSLILLIAYCLAAQQPLMAGVKLLIRR